MSGEHKIVGGAREFRLRLCALIINDLNDEQQKIWHDCTHVIEYSAYENAVYKGFAVIKILEKELEEERAKHDRVLKMLEIAKTALEVYAMTNKTFPEYGTVARDVLAQIESLK